MRCDIPDRLSLSFFFFWWRKRRRFHLLLEAPLHAIPRKRQRLIVARFDRFIRILANVEFCSLSAALSDGCRIKFCDSIQEM